MSERRIAQSAGLIGAATLASRLLGLVRDQVQGYYFADGHAADAFGVATRIPTLLRDLFAEGAMSAAFVPTFTRYLANEGKAAAWRLGSQVINALLLITGAIVLVGIAFAGPITSEFAGDYAAVPGKLEMTVDLVRVNMPFLTMVALAAAFMGMLNALRRFFIPACSPATYNIVFILCVLVSFWPLQQAGVDPVMSLSIGMLLGGVVQVAIQWPVLRQEGYRHSWSLDFRDPGLREVLFLMGPGSLGVAAAQINLLVNTHLATGESHAVSALQYAFRLMYMPIGIVGVSVATAAIPELSRSAAHNDHGAMRTTLSWSLRLMLVLSLPATIGLMVLAYPIVEMLFQYGPRWDNASTSRVADALLYYAPGIVGYSVVKIVSPTFYAMRDARTPVIVSVITILANLGLNIWLYRVMGFRGLALGTGIAANVNAGLLLYLLARRVEGLEGRRLAVTFLKTAAATLAMGVAVYFTESGLRAVLPSEIFGYLWISRAVRVALSIGAGLGALALGAWVMRLEEFAGATSRLLRRFSR